MHNDVRIEDTIAETTQTTPATGTESDPGDPVLELDGVSKRYGSESAVSRTFGVITKWFVYAIAILAAANVLAIETLSAWIQTVVSYIPAFIAGLAVIIGGFVVADFIGDAIMRARGPLCSRPLGLASGRSV